MVTYIVYEESKQYQLSSFLFLYQSFQDYGEVHIVKKPEQPADLPECLNAVQQQNVSEWRIIFLDCSQVYPCENPYDRYEERFRYIEEFLEIRPSAGNGKFERAVTRFLPAQIYCVTMRSGFYFHSGKEGILYSDFAVKYRSNYRYFVYDVGKEEPESPENLLFHVICSVLILALNEWPGAMLETGYLYQCGLGLDEAKLSEYITEMEETRRHISNLLYQEKHTHSQRKAYLDYVQNMSDKMEPLEEPDKTIPFCTEAFPFAVNDNNSELYSWRMKNIHALQRLEELKKDPVRRWEKEIDKKKNQMLPEHGMEDFRRKYLTENGWRELFDKKRECAEAIFKEQVLDQELQKRLQESEKMVQRMEKEISSRMTKKSVGILLGEAVFGICMIGAAFAMLLVGEFLGDRKNFMLWTAALLYIIMAISFCMYFLFLERKHTQKLLNKSLRNVDNSLIRTDSMYNQVLNKILIHKKYSLLEQQQRELLREERERMKILKEHEEMLVRSEGNIRQLLWIFGKPPVMSFDSCSSVTVDFSRHPQETIYYYMPHYKNVYDFTMEGSGIRIQVPFSFIRSFEIRKLYLPYVYHENQAEGTEQMTGEMNYNEYGNREITADN